MITYSSSKSTIKFETGRKSVVSTPTPFTLLSDTHTHHRQLEFFYVSMLLAPTRVRTPKTSLSANLPTISGTLAHRSTAAGFDLATFRSRVLCATRYTMTCFFPCSQRPWSGGGRVVKLLACGARGPRFDSPPRHLNFRDWLSPSSKSRYG